MLGTISAFAFRHRETKKNLRRDGKNLCRDDGDDDDDDDNNNNNNNNNKLQLVCHPAAVVILHVYKI